MMVYVLLPRGDLGWDDLRIFTTFAAVEPLVTQSSYIIAFEGTDELKPMWVYQLEYGVLRRYPLSRSP
jgi:hypothetical protein